MNTPLLVVAADTHLRPIVWARYPTLYGDTFDSLHQLVDTAIGINVPLLLLGDIFDKARPDSESVMQFTDAAGRLAAKGLDIYYIQGNHDYADPPWPSVAKNAISLHNKKIVLADGTTLVGLDYQRSDELVAAVAGLDALRPFDFVCMHQAWSELQGIGSTQGSFKLFKPGDKVLTGDYHVRKDIAVQVEGGAVYVHSPGSTSLQAIDEPSDKYCGVLSKTGEAYSITPVQLATRRVYHAWADNEADFSAALQVQFEQEKYMPLLRVTYSDTIAEAFTRLVTAYNGRAFLFPKQVTSVVEAQAVEQASEDSAVTLEDALRAMPLDPVVAGIAKALLQNPDTFTVLKDARERFHHAAQTTKTEELLQPS